MKNNDMQKVRDSVLKQVKPDSNVDSKVQDFVSRLEDALKKGKVSAKVIVGGSFAKGTYLKNNYDCDVFIQFPISAQDKDISVILFKSLSKSFKDVEVIHGSRDYYKIREGIVYEIVPILETKDPKDAKNVTDMSPMHVVWANRYFSKKPKLRDEILLSKAFCKAQRVYGAESYIGGFSGHVLDILIIKYGSFIELLTQSQKWKEKDVIDVEGFYKTKQLAMMGINQSKTLSPLVVVDPILAQRNAAAALTFGKYNDFIHAAKEFLKSPNISFFCKQPIDENSVLSKFSKKNVKLVIIKLKPLEGKEDIIGTKLLKSYEYVLTLLKRKDFEVLSSAWEWDDKKDAALFFVFENKELSATKEFPGPFMFQKQHVEAFKKSHKNVVLKDKKYLAIEKREFVEPEKYLKTLFKNKSLDKDYLDEKSKEQKVIKVITK